MGDWVQGLIEVDWTELYLQSFRLWLLPSWNWSTWIWSSSSSSTCGWVLFISFKQQLINSIIWNAQLLINIYVPVYLFTGVYVSLVDSLLPEEGRRTHGIRMRKSVASEYIQINVLIKLFVTKNVDIGVAFHYWCGPHLWQNSSQLPPNESLKETKRTKNKKTKKNNTSEFRKESRNDVRSWIFVGER